jgi:LysR family transcriptional regulator, glycine cleavage system transcriptional activator
LAAANEIASIAHEESSTSVAFGRTGQLMVPRLPPLNGLRLFEAAARHTTFKQAAEELNVTPSAVSHAVLALEEWLGTKLFNRSARGLILTPAGSQFAAAIGEALARIAVATQRLPGRRATGALSVSSAPTFATRWLLPRLPRFAGQYPDIQVSIDTSLRPVELPLDGVDLAIRMAREAKSKGRWIRLIEESLVPVCSPLIRARLGNRISDILSEVPLIHVTSVSEDWADWFRAAGIDPPDLKRGLRVDTIQMSLEAAAQGLGIALGRKPLIDDALVQGHLVEAGGLMIPAATSYWLVGAESTFERPEIRLFRNWLLSELDDGGQLLED